MRLVYILLPLVILSCGKPQQAVLTENSKAEENTPQNPVDEPPAPIPSPDPVSESPKSEICYQKNCLTLINSSSVNSNDYFYLDPFTDPGFPNSFNPNLYISPNRLLPLFDEDLDKTVSKNFKVGEFLSPKKGLFGILQIKLLKAIQNIRGKIKSAVTITSGYRSPGYNSQIGGAARFSRHQYGDAIDFFSSSASLKELEAQCRSQKASFVQVYKTHIHCDWRLLAPDFHFYDPDPIPLTPKVGIYTKLSSQIVIYVRVENNIVTFKTRGVYKEDGEDITYSWKITDPKGRTHQSSQKSPQLALVPGKYHIEVSAGETLSSHQEIIIN